MEHTHLVKGLDYALLQKVRSEIQHKEIEQEAEMERLATQALETTVLFAFNNYFILSINLNVFLFNKFTLYHYNEKLHNK